MRVLARLVLVVVFLASGASAQDFFAGGGDGNDPFDITADTVELGAGGDVYIARGNVEITQPDRTLTADWVMFSNSTQQGVAAGNVVLLEGEDQLFGDVLHFEVDDLKGIVLKGTLLAESGFIVKGETMRKIGDELYEIDESRFTTCNCEPGETEPWVISSKRADIEFGGYATTRNSTFDVFGIPILWTPWMRYPIKTERETGLLFPEFNTATRDGFSFGVPFFWAPHDQVGLRLTPYWTEDHGAKYDAELDYVYGRESRGVLFGAIVPDDDTVLPNDPGTPFDAQRWAVDWLHDHRFSDGPGGDFMPFGTDWRLGIDARVVSDNLYAFDFRDLSDLRENRYIESTMFVEGYLGENRAYSLSVAGQHGDDIQNPDDQDRDDFLIHRAPDIRLSQIPKPIPFVGEGGGFGKFFSFDARYTHFWAFEDVVDTYPTAVIVGDQQFADTGIDAIPDGFERNRAGQLIGLDGTITNPDGTVITAAELLAADALLEMPLLTDPMALLAATSPDGSLDDFPGPEGDGIFQEGEPIADRGHRVILNPRVHFPFRVADAFEVMPELGWLGFFYNTDGQSSETQNYLTAHLDVRSRLRKTIDLPFGIGRAVHLVEPRFQWAAIFGDEDDDLPLFVPRPLVAQERVRQLELTGALRDPSDRIREMNAISFSVGNRIYVPGRTATIELPDGTSEDVQLPPRLWAEFTASFLYDFENDDFQNLYLDGTGYPFQNVRTRFHFGYDLDQNEFSEALMQITYGTPDGYDLGFTYRYVTDIPRFFENFQFSSERFDEFEEGFLEVNQIDLFARIPITRYWAVSYRLGYSFESSLTLTNQAGVEYVSKCFCWAIRLEAREDRVGGLEFNFRYRIIGLGDDTIRPFSRRRRGSRDPLIDDEPFLTDRSGI